jgi:hypothetical protein
MVAQSGSSLVMRGLLLERRPLLLASHAVMLLAQRQ